MTRTDISLDHPRPEDAPAIAAAMANPAVSGWLSSVTQPYGLKDAHDFIASAGPGECAIRVDGRFAGMIRIADPFGYWLAPDFQQQGIGTRAGVLALSRRFDDAACATVEATVMAGNVASLALLARLGFAVTGRVQITPRTGAPRPGHRLRVTRTGFATAQPLTLRGNGWDAVPPDAAARAALYPVATAPEVARMLLRYHEDMPRGAFDALFPEWAACRPMRLAIRLGGRVVGSIGIGPGPCPPVFYFLSPEARGQGLASAALEAMTREALARWPIEALTAGVMADNPASGRVLEKAGFVRGAAIAVHSLGRDGVAPGWEYRRTR